jgi:hypothetical protein
MQKRDHLRIPVILGLGLLILVLLFDPAVPVAGQPAALPTSTRELCHVCDEGLPQSVAWRIQP